MRSGTYRRPERAARYWLCDRPPVLRTAIARRSEMLVKHPGWAARSRTAAYVSDPEGVNIVSSIGAAR